MRSMSLWSNVLHIVSSASIIITIAFVFQQYLFFRMSSYYLLIFRFLLCSCWRHLPHYHLRFYGPTFLCSRQSSIVSLLLFVRRAELQSPLVINYILFSWKSSMFMTYACIADSKCFDRFIVHRCSYSVNHFFYLPNENEFFLSVITCSKNSIRQKNSCFIFYSNNSMEFLIICNIVTLIPEPSAIHCNCFTCREVSKK